MAFAGSVVELVDGGLELGVGDGGEVGAFGEVLAQQTVGVLVAAALPGGVGVGEVDLDTGGDGEAGVAGHLLAAVPGQGLHRPPGPGQRGGQARQRSLRGGLVGQVERGEVAAGAFDHGADRGGGAGRADDQVAFVVARDQPALDLAGRSPIGTAPTIWPRVSRPCGCCAAAARSARCAVGPQLAAQLPAGLDVDRPVDRLVADPHLLIIGELHQQPARDLLGGQPLVQPLLDPLLQLRVLRQLRRPGPGPRPHRRLLAGLGLVARPGPTAAGPAPPRPRGRRSSRLIVDADRPIRRPISRTPTSAS